MNFFAKAFNNILLEKDYPLRLESIDMVSMDIEKYQDKLKISHSDMIKLRLKLETVLLFYLEKSSAFNSFSMKIYTKFNRVYLRINIAGECCNYLENGVNEYAQILISAINDNNFTESYNYRQGVNTITFGVLKASVNPVFYTLAALVAAFLTGFVFSLFPPEIGRTVSDSCLRPIFNVVIGLLKMISSLMIFFAVITGMCSLGDISQFSKQGRILLSGCISRSYAAVLITTVTCVLLFNLVNTEYELNLSLFVFLLKTILDMIPVNAFTPFTEGNAMQILFLAIGAGILILMNSEKTAALMENIKQINIIIMSGVTNICRLAPLLVYLSISMMILDGSINAILGVWKVPVVFLIVLILILTTCYFSLSRQLNRPVFQLLRENIPIGLIGFTTASSSACTEKIIGQCRDKYGIPTKKAGFYFPLVQMFYKAGPSAIYTTFLYVMCAQYEITVSLTSIIINTVVMVLMGLATAPIPSSDIPLAVILIASVGLPNETIAIYTTIAFLLDMMSTGTVAMLYTPEIAAIDKKINASENI